MDNPTTVFLTRKILTVNPGQPQAEAVAVREGRIVGVGSADELRAQWPDRVDTTFAGKVLTPGFVEGHSHLMEGGMWNFVYVGFYDRRGPDGTLWTGLKRMEDVVERLKEAEARLADPAEPLLAWGFDPVYFDTARMTAGDLDHVSASRRIAVIHASFHILNANSALLSAAGIDRFTGADGVVKGPDGSPSGELREFAAMFPVFRVLDNAFFAAGDGEEGIRNFGRTAVNSGVTTATDLINGLTDEGVATLKRVTSGDDFPLRIVPAFKGFDVDPARGVELVRKRQLETGERLRFGPVKLVLDGSIQGFTARVRWPGYHNGSPNGQWVMPPGEVADVVLAYHRAGLQLHIHTNGDEATDVALDAIERALALHPRWDHRHTLQHVQLADASQFRRMAALGVCANLFANHLYYWGDIHYARTVGPDRARRMNATGTAKREGVRYAIHSDAPITPLAPLFTAWCAVNRRTASGRILGESERIEAGEALRAITLGAAYTLKLDHEIGTIEVGKRADFAVLEDDPLAVAPEKFADVRIWGTVSHGRVFRAPRPG